MTACTKVSEGCDHCYAETFAERWRGVPGHPFEQGFDVRLWPERLTLPLRWRKPRRVFLNSMSDLWHEAVGADLIAQVFAVIAVAEQHTFQVLTKRPGRMHSLLGDDAFWDQVGKAVGLYDPSAEAMAAIEGRSLPNLWLGSRWETQKWVPVRLGKLAATSVAAVRFASCEPLLGELDIRRWLTDGLEWVIAGGESGPGAARCTRTGPGLFVISAWPQACRTSSSFSAPAQNGLRRRGCPKGVKRQRLTRPRIERTASPSSTGTVIRTMICITSPQRVSAGCGSRERPIAVRAP